VVCRFISLFLLCLFTHSISDCEEGLVCHQRNENDPVPGCAGERDVPGGVDFCIRASDETAKPPVAGAFRLKLYWEYGYKWQGQSWEKEYCMICEASMEDRGAQCESDDLLTIDTCNDESTWFVFENLLSDGQTQLQVAESTLCLEQVSSRRVELRTCQATSSHQKFVAGDGSFFGDDDKFELKPAYERGCLSQPHHPKPDELIFVTGCDSARNSDTSFWNPY